MGLPFLVVHGALVSKVLPAVLMVLGVASVLLLRRRRARRRSHTLAQVRLREVQPRASGLVTIRGTLRGGSAATVRQDFGIEKSWRADTLWLEHDDGDRTGLIGNIDVEVGATERGLWRSADTVAVPEARARYFRSLERVVADGDRIVVRGEVTPPEPLAEPRSAESPAPLRAWQIIGTPTAPLAITAVAPKPAVVPLGPLRWFALVGLVAVISYGGLALVGSRMLKAAARAEPIQPARATFTSVGAWSPLAIAAALPGTRDDTLARLRNELDANFEHTEATLDLRLALDELEGTCPAEDLDRAGRLAAAIAAAQRCGELRYARALLAIDARYDDAAVGIASDATDYLATTLAIARGRWQAAAAGAAKAGQPCLAALLRGYGGEALPFDHLPDRAQCALEEAMALPAGKRAAALAALPPQPGSRDFLLSDLRRLWAPSDTDVGVLDLGSQVSLAWLARFASPAGLTEPSGTALRERLVQLETIRGDFAAARRELAELTKHDSWIDALPALYEGSGEPPPAKFGPRWLGLRWGQPADREAVFAIPEECPLAAALTTAAAGDGGPLATVLAQCNVPAASMDDSDNAAILAVLPRVTTHRAELARVLRMRIDKLWDYDLDVIPFQITVEAAVHRDTARLVGDPEAAAQWQGILARTDAMLSDQRKVIAFLFWSRN